MPIWLIWLISAEYLIAAVWFGAIGNVGLALFCGGCVIANAGLLLR